MSSFSGKLKTQAWMIAPETQKIMRTLQEDGGDARFVGGCVRNALVNRKVIDIDITTPLKPEQVIERLTRNKIPYAPTGIAHGTVTAIVDGHPFEITTLRLDVATFGRHAQVEFTDDWQADAARRDFTINAIFSTLEGDIYDPFGGVEDLRLGRVRFVGEASERIEEDTLRILRFFRFYAHFGKDAPDATALAACAAAAGKIPALSAERIRQEILKLLESDRCAAVWQLMLDHGIIAQCLPRATNVTQLENLVQLEIACDSTAFALRRLAAVLDAPADELKNILKGLRLSNDQTAQLLQMAHPAANVSMRMKEAEVKKLVYRSGNDMARSLLLLAAAATGDKEALMPLYQAATSFRAPRFPLQGDDVLKTGIPAGPEVGRILGMIENWWIEKDFVPGRSECLIKLRSEFMPPANDCN